MVGMLAGNGHAVLVNVGKVSLGMPFIARRKIVQSNFGLNFVLTFQRKPFMFGHLSGLYRSLSPWFYLIEQLNVTVCFRWSYNRAFG